MRRRVLIFLVVIGAASALAQSPSSRVPGPRIRFAPRSYVCFRAASKVDVDGRLTESDWLRAAWTDDFVDIEGSLKPRPRYKTRAKLLWDDEYFYVAAELEEPHVWATLDMRDSIIFYDNDFEVFIDPDGDTHRYFELEVNALATVWDLFLIKPYRDSDQPPAVHSWDIQGLRCAVAVEGTLNDSADTDRGWTVEVAFPWSVLKECAPGKRPPLPGEQWRMNFSRVEYRVQRSGKAYAKEKDPATGKPFPEDNWVWTPQGVVNIHYPEMWGYVQFSGLPVGSGGEAFLVKDEERVKWALRRIYYAQWAFRASNGSFADSLEALGLADLGLEGFGRPVIETTPNTFEVLCAGPSGESWHILQDGLVERLK